VPAAAQDTPVVPATPPNLQAAPNAPGDLTLASPFNSMSAIGTEAIAASGDNVYVLRGRTLYQLRAADLSEVAHKELPIAGVGTIAGSLSGPADIRGGRLASPAAPQTPDATAGTATPVTPDIAPAAPGSAPAPAVGSVVPLNGGMFTPMAGGVRMTATGGYIYILSGDTLYQVRASDLSLVSSKPLSMPGVGGTGLSPLTTPTNPSGLNPAPRRGRGRRGQQPGATAPTTPAP